MQTPSLFIVTGASRGLGRAIVEQALAPGRTLVCISRGMEPALALAAQSCGARLVQWSIDLQQPTVAANRLAGFLAEQDGSVFARTVLVNNAATVGQPGPLGSADAADLTRALRIGLEAPLLLCAAFLRGTQAWPGARQILNISSGLGRHAIPSQSAYCAAKAGMDHFSRVIALEQALRPCGARVVSLAPGVIDTDMQSALRATDARLLPDRARYEQLKAENRLDAPALAASKVLAYLERADFGSQPVGDVNAAA